MDRMQKIFRPESKYRAFFLSVLTVGLAYGLYKGVIDNYLAEVVSDSPEEVRATISTGVSVNHLITILIALFGGWIWETLGIETLFILSAVLGLCNSAYAATIKVKKKEV